MQMNAPLLPALPRSTGREAPPAWGWLTKWSAIASTWADLPYPYGAGTGPGKGDLRRSGRERNKSTTDYADTTDGGMFGICAIRAIRG